MVKKSGGNEEGKQEQEYEILKAVAQAWLGHSGSSSPANESDARRRNFQSRPSRFKLEAVHMLRGKRVASPNWDFRQSLWDSYEIVTVTKQLERGLELDDPFVSGQGLVHRRRKESKNSLRNLFDRFSSRRFNESDVPRVD